MFSSRTWPSLSSVAVSPSPEQYMTRMLYYWILLSHLYNSTSPPLAPYLILWTLQFRLFLSSTPQFSCWFAYLHTMICSANLVPDLVLSIWLSYFSFSYHCSALMPQLHLAHLFLWMDPDSMIGTMNVQNSRLCMDCYSCQARCHLCANLTICTFNLVINHWENKHCSLRQPQKHFEV